MKYAYPARFEQEENGRYSVYFVDMELATFGDDLSDAAYMAQDALKVWVGGMLEDGESLPKPSNPLKVKAERPNVFVSLVYVEANPASRRC
jgi:predicted RNase H-like HicB family nuclease